MCKRSIYLALVVTLVFGVLAMATPLKQDGGPDGIVSVEAENYDNNTPQGGNQWELVEQQGATGMQALPNSGSNRNADYIENAPYLDFEVEFVKTGIHYVWVKAWGAGGGDDSCHVMLNNTASSTSDRMTGFNNNYGWFSTTMDSSSRPTIDIPSTGVHIISIYQRENGAFIDKLVLTTSESYTPTGDGPPESTRGPAFKASGPAPSSGATDVPYYTDLSWTAGDFAVAHNVYFGTVFDDVNEASVADPRGVLLAEGTTDTSVAPMLELGQTYHWRVDEVNAPPGDIHKGDTWTFTLEPVAYTLGGGNITATASGQLNEQNGPENTINGSGMADGLHDANDKNMWLAPTGLPVWIQWEFDKVYMLNDMKVWNQNQLLEMVLGLSAKDVVIEVSEDGETFVPLGDPMVLAQGMGAAGAPAGDVIDMGGVLAKAVKMTINTSHGFLTQAGLAEVQFSYIPANPREFSPSHGASLDGLTADLSWRAGRFAVEHEVVLSADLAAVQDGSAVIATTADKSYTATGLDYGMSYYYTVVDVAEDGMKYPGTIQRLLTPSVGVIDDMEMYKDEELLEIWAFWADGYNDDTNGSTVGNGSAPETGEVYEGAQSMPMAYDNSTAAMSEATRTFDSQLDLTAGNAETIGVYFKGVPYEFNGYYSQDGPDFWTAMTLNPLPVAMGDEATLGVVLTSHNRGAVATATFSEIATEGGVSGDWTVEAIGSADAGHPADIGGITGAEATLMAGGNDIWNTADEFVYAYKQLSGEGAIQAKVDTLDEQDNWTKAGVMIRNSADASASYASVQVTGVNGIRFQYRDADGVSAESDSVVLDGTQELLSEPAWIKVERVSVNDAAEVYLKITDTANQSVTIPHPDPAATRIGAWTLLSVELSELAGINAASVKSITVGVRGAGAVGRIYVDYLHLQDVPPAPVASDPGTDALMAYYALDGDTLDSSGNGLDGVSAAPMFVDGVVGQALAVSADDPNTIVDLGMKPEFNVTGDLSVSLWANLDPATQNWSALVVNRGESGIGWQVRRRGGDSKICFTVRGTPATDDLRGDNTIEFGEWVHFAGAYNSDPVSGERRNYYNGELDIMAIDGGVIPAAAHNVYLGARANSANDGLERILTGMIDEVRIYTKPLTAGEVLFLSQP